MTLLPRCAESVNVPVSVGAVKSGAAAPASSRVLMVRPTAAGLTPFPTRGFAPIFQGAALLVMLWVAPSNAPLAQLAEQLTLNQWVPGSSPGGCTTHEGPVHVDRAFVVRG